MERSLLSHLPDCNAYRQSEPSDFEIVETAEITTPDGAKYPLYVIGIKSHQGVVDIVQSISNKNGRGHAGLKFCPIENVASYTVLEKGRVVG